MGIKRIGDFYNLLMRIVFVRNEINCQQTLAALINTGIICLRVNGVTHTFILDSHALVQAQRAARQGAGFNGLTIG